jgi:hypothetical protein
VASVYGVELFLSTMRLPKTTSAIIEDNDAEDMGLDTGLRSEPEEDEWRRPLLVSGLRGNSRSSMSSNMLSLSFFFFFFLISFSIDDQGRAT